MQWKVANHDLVVKEQNQDASLMVLLLITTLVNLHITLQYLISQTILVFFIYPIVIFWEHTQTQNLDLATQTEYLKLMKDSFCLQNS